MTPYTGVNCFVAGCRASKSGNHWVLNLVSKDHADKGIFFQALEERLDGEVTCPVAVGSTLKGATLEPVMDPETEFTTPLVNSEALSAKEAAAKGYAKVTFPFVFVTEYQEFKAPAARTGVLRQAAAAKAA